MMLCWGWEVWGALQSTGLGLARLRGGSDAAVGWVLGLSTCKAPAVGVVTCVDRIVEGVFSACVAEVMGILSGVGLTTPLGRRQTSLKSSCPSLSHPAKSLGCFSSGAEGGGDN